MRNVLMSCVMVAAMVVGWSPVRAAPDAAAGAGPKGSVKGKVVGADGKPAAGVPVRLMQRAGKAAAGAGENVAEPGAEPGKGQKGRAAAKPSPVAETTADASGEFVFADVPAGRYVAMARVKGVGNARAPVNVTAGSTSEVTLTLKGKGEGKAKAKAAKKAGVL